MSTGHAVLVEEGAYRACSALLKRGMLGVGMQGVQCSSSREHAWRVVLFKSAACSACKVGRMHSAWPKPGASICAFITFKLLPEAIIGVLISTFQLWGCTLELHKQKVSPVHGGTTLYTDAPWNLERSFTCLGALLCIRDFLLLIEAHGSKAGPPHMHCALRHASPLKFVIHFALGRWDLLALTGAQALRHASTGTCSHWGTLALGHARTGAHKYWDMLAPGHASTGTLWGASSPKCMVAHFSVCVCLLAHSQALLISDAHVLMKTVGAPAVLPGSYTPSDHVWGSARGAVFEHKLVGNCCTWWVPTKWWVIGARVPCVDFWPGATCRHSVGADQTTRIKGGCYWAASHADSHGDAATDTQELPSSEAQEEATGTQPPDMPAPSEWS
eukprot:scaffold58541_cov21-Tisochrysis_lutea.AAC.2